MYLCKKCKIPAFLTTKDIKYSKTLKTLVSDEIVIQFECRHCNHINMLQTNIFDKDYSKNLLIYNYMFFHIYSLNLRKKVFPKDLERYLHHEFIFHKCRKKNSKLVYTKSLSYPDTNGIYILQFKDPAKRLNKLYIFRFYKNKRLRKKL